MSQKALALEAYTKEKENWNKIKIYCKKEYNHKINP